MNDKNKVILTKEGLESVKSELEKLYQERKSIQLQIKEAKSYGDLSENSEYQDAKDRQVLTETRIAEMENIIRNAVIDTGTCTDGGVCIGSNVTVNSGGREFTYTLVGATQADPTAGKVSVESPIGQSLMGKKKGEEITVKAPRGKIKMKIMKVA